jgi:predicted metalloprotease with PDZ domain
MLGRILFAFSLVTLVPCAASAAPVKLAVDASEVTRRVIHVAEVIPAEAGPLTLHYPRWIPGRHRQVGQIANVSDLRIKANGEPITWKRDDTDPFTIHCTVPKGADAIELHFDLLLASGSEGGAAFMTVASPKMMTMNWNDVLWYPKTPKALELRFKAAVRLPKGWGFGTALSPSDELNEGRVSFGEVTLETLIDSPVLAGEHVRIIPIGPMKERHHVYLACDSPDGLEVTPETLKAWDKLPAEAAALYGPNRPYENYTFLLGLSNHVPRAGIEHHQSSDNRLSELALIKAGERRMSATLFPHEYTHSWNGKFRRPADMIVPDYQTPHQTRLLWVYEGLTNYLGWLLAARCGLFSPEDAREYLALTASRMSNSRGRSWRPLDDTAAAASVLFDAPRSWGASRRMVDFYDEGTLLWLEVDVMIRTQTKGAKSLDDFCKAFFGMGEGKPVVKGYKLTDVVAALNEVSPYDWKTHFARRVEAVTDAAPLEGITGAGWKLAFAEKPSELFLAQEGLTRGVNMLDSLGLLLGPEGAITDVVPTMPAAEAGLAPGMKVLAVNSRRYSADSLKTAVANTKTGAKLELLIESGDFFKTHPLDYKLGARYPRLEKVEGRDDVLAEIVKPRAK